MNTLQSCRIANPENITAECSQFEIDDTTVPFTLSKIMTVGNEYTFSFWIKSQEDGSVQVCGETYSTLDTWQKYFVVFTATNTDLAINFLKVGTYFVYHPKLEVGNMVTDWTPAPEDMATAEDINDANKQFDAITEQISSLNKTASGITASVQEVRKLAQEGLDSVNGNIETITKEVSAKMTKDAVEFQIKSAMENGTKKVVTETGFTFDDVGLTVEKTGSEMKTQITEDGMTVYQNEEEVLEANSNGVNAKNLHATTYLIVGGRSRFENYGNNRTGCFWIGG